MPSSPAHPSSLTGLAVLRQLATFLRPYRKHLALALMVLVIAALAALSLPLAVRQVIDQGFTQASTRQIDHGFLLLFGVALYLVYSPHGVFISFPGWVNGW